MTDSDSDPNSSASDNHGDRPRSRLSYLRRFRRRERNEDAREARRLRIRRHGRRAYIRSVYSLPSLATLGNAVCGFGAMYIAALSPGGSERWAPYRFMIAAYL